MLVLDCGGLQMVRKNLEGTGLGGNGSDRLPVTRKYCCIAELRSINLFSALHSLAISLLM